MFDVQSALQVFKRKQYSLWKTVWFSKQIFHQRCYVQLVDFFFRKRAVHSTGFYSFVKGIWCSWSCNLTEKNQTLWHNWQKSCMVYLIESSTFKYIIGENFVGENYWSPGKYFVYFPRQKYSPVILQGNHFLIFFITFNITDQWKIATGTS